MFCPMKGPEHVIASAFTRKLVSSEYILLYFLNEFLVYLYELPKKVSA